MFNTFALTILAGHSRKVDEWRCWIRCLNNWWCKLQPRFTTDARLTYAYVTQMPEKALRRSLRHHRCQCVRWHSSVTCLHSAGRTTLIHGEKMAFSPFWRFVTIWVHHPFAIALSTYATNRSSGPYSENNFRVFLELEYFRVSSTRTGDAIHERL